MLFVLVMEVVNAMISAADRRGVLQPLPSTRIRTRSSLYADDLVILLSPVGCRQQPLVHPSDSKSIR
jgi:hypothetical protein